MAKTAKPVPEGFHTLTPHLVVKGASGAIDWYRKAFGAEEMFRMPGPDNTVMHAELRIGDSPIMVNDEFPEHGARGPVSVGGTPVTLHMYVPDADAVFDRAVKAGAKVLMPLADMFWGDRYGQLQDPYGHRWSIATHKEDVPPEEIPARMKASGMC
jgi:PhnB protein